VALTLAQGHNGSGPTQSMMPDTAIAAGVVDPVPTVEAMGPRLAAHARSYHPPADDAAAADAPCRLPRGGDLPHPLSQTGHDFWATSSRSCAASSGG
jgi:hypothetical protein